MNHFSAFLYIILVAPRFNAQFGNRYLAEVSQKEVLKFLLSPTGNNKQAGKSDTVSLT